MERSVRRKILSLPTLLALFLLPLGVFGESLYVANFDGNTIARITSDGIGSVFANSGVNEPLGLAFDHNGRFYASSYLDDTVLTFAPDGTSSVWAGTDLETPYAMAFDSAGSLYVGNVSNGNTYPTNILKITPAGTSSIFAEGSLTFPVGMAFDGANNLYVSDLTSIFKFAPDGTRSVFATSANAMYGLAFDSLGNLYAAEYFSGLVAKFDSGGVRSIFAALAPNDPIGLTIDSADNVYVGGYASSTIIRFTPGGIGSLFANSSDGIDGPVHILMGPDTVVPEPGTCALIFLGTALLANRRQRRERQFFTKADKHPRPPSR